MCHRDQGTRMDPMAEEALRCQPSILHGCNADTVPSSAALGGKAGPRTHCVPTGTCTRGLVQFWPCATLFFCGEEVTGMAGVSSLPPPHTVATSVRTLPSLPKKFTGPLTRLN